MGTSGGSDTEITSISLSPGDAPWGPVIWTNAIDPPWGMPRKPSAHWVDTFEAISEIKWEETSSSLRPGGDLPTSENTTGFGTRLRVRDDADHIDSRMHCSLDDCTHMLTVTGASRIFTLGGDTDLDGWVWPAATHVLVAGSRDYAFMTDAAPRAVYTQLKHSLHFVIDGGHGSTLPAFPACAGNVFHSPAADTVIWPSGGKFLFSGANVYSALLGLADQGIGRPRSLVWGLPPTCRVYAGANSTFSGSNPGNRTVEISAMFESAVTTQQSTVAVASYSMPAIFTGTFGFWRWEYLNTAESLSSVAVPDWADTVQITLAVLGDVGHTFAQSWLPWAPRHGPLAVTSEHGGIYIPGIVRQVA